MGADMHHPGHVPRDRPADADVLYVAARAPRPGFTKSRLGRAIGHQQAAELYAAFVRDLALRLSTANVRVGWYVTPEDAWPELAPLIPPGVAHRSRPGPVLPQGPGDWTERQRALFAGAGARGERRTVLIASDSPQLDTEVVGAAFARLAHDDLVLGPTDDGGYYLIGMRTGLPTARIDADGASAGPRDGQTGLGSVAVRPWDALSGVRMSTGTVLDEILVRAASVGLRASLLPPTFDVDEAADLSRLIPLALARADLAATRAALDRLGLLPLAAPRVERTGLVAAAAGGAR